jgi:hypothetical protein
MGRAKKYTTEEEKINALKERQKRYYEKNKEKICKRNLESYYENVKNAGI